MANNENGIILNDVLSDNASLNDARSERTLTEEENNSQNLNLLL